MFGRILATVPLCIFRPTHTVRLVCKQFDIYIGSLFFCHSPNFTFTNHTTQPLKVLEEDMSNLDISEDTENNMKVHRMFGVDSSLMRRSRRNSAQYDAPDKTDKVLKKKNINSKTIEKLYTNKSLGRVKHTQLETIFEHADETNGDTNDEIDTTKVFGKAKVKRAIACTDFLKPSKTLKEKRKRRIQKMFGAHKKFKSMTKAKFMEIFNQLNFVDVPKQTSDIPTDV